jgi:predicted nucleic acid-binding protein
MIYLDTGIIVSALYLRDDFHEPCRRLVRPENVTSTHALAEAFSTLNGQYRVANDMASEAILSAAEVLQVAPILKDDYVAVLKTARARSVQGGGVYDALHAQVARRLKVKKLLTINLNHFQHCGYGLDVAMPVA